MVKGISIAKIVSLVKELQSYVLVKIVLLFFLLVTGADPGFEKGGAPGQKVCGAGGLGAQSPRSYSYFICFSLKILM